MQTQKTQTMAAAREENLRWTAVYLSAAERSLLAEHTRNPGVWTPETMASLAAILARIPPTEAELELYSGAEHAELVFGRPMNLPYFTSSYDRGVALRYAAAYKCLLTLRVPAGSKVVFLDDLSVHGHAEAEVLLSGDAVLKVTRILLDDMARAGVVVVEADYLRGGLRPPLMIPPASRNCELN